MAFKMKGFKPHNMYDKKFVETKEEHLALKEKGYSHSPYKTAKKKVGMSKRRSSSSNVA
tara:strand:- start:424 stop:600 length:177 start_codon:yes stop_codon:yes gene_type:complete